jgi:hypothetical protein
MADMDKFATTVARECTRVLQQARNTVEQHQVTKQMFEAETKLFLETGIAKITADLEARVGSFGVTASTHFRELAKERNRFALIAQEEQAYARGVGYRNTLGFTMPRTARLKSVIAGMLLVARECDSTNDSGYLLSPVTSTNSKNTWRLWFNGPEGLDIFDSFRERCRTDPVLRIVLRLNG